MDNISGRKWARSFLSIALAVSLIGNVAHTVLADSHISLWLRVPGAFVWPMFAFGGIEILVRMRWLRTKAHAFARFMVLLPVLPAAITSYEHLRSMLVMMGERVFISNIGPAVVDGMMLGCTLVLLFTRPVPAPLLLGAPEVEEVLEKWDIREITEAAPEMLEEAPVSPAPLAPKPEERAPRSSPGEIPPALRAAVSALIAGEAPVITQGASRSVVGRYITVLRILRDNPHAAIDVKASRVRPELVDMLRSHAREVAPR